MRHRIDAKPGRSCHIQEGVEHVLKESPIFREGNLNDRACHHYKGSLEERMLAPAHRRHHRLRDLARLKKTILSGAAKQRLGIG